MLAENIGKKFGRQWIFRNLHFKIENGSSLAITGNNGSGKSTLLKILAQYSLPSEGNIKLSQEDPASQSFVSTDMEIIEEFNLTEFYDFHASFKEPLIGLEEIAKNTGLPKNKPIADFSSGMKQRVKLITAFYFKNEIHFYDEPTVNLDANGIMWFSENFNNKRNTINVIASNLSNEIGLCDKSIQL